MIIFLGHKVNENQLSLAESEIQHCYKTLRKRSGDTITVHDGSGYSYEAIITDLSKKQILAEIISQTEHPRLEKLHLTIALTKSLDRIEWLVSKSVEIGVTDFTFVNCKRSEKRHFRYERMQRIIESACKQSLKYHFPTLTQSVIPFSESLLPQQEVAQRYIASYKPDNPHLSTLGDGVKSAHVMIGPEGDFTPDEVSLAVANGYTQINLGHQRLRTETAGLYAMTLLRAALDNNAIHT